MAATLRHDVPEDLVDTSAVCCEAHSLMYRRLPLCVSEATQLCIGTSASSAAASSASVASKVAGKSAARRPHLGTQHTAPTHIAHSTWTHSTQHLSTQHTAPGHIARCTYALSTQHLGTQHTAPKHKAYSTEHKAQRMDAVQWHPDRHSCVESKALVEFGCCMTQSAQHAADKGLSVSYWGRSRTGTLTVSR